MRTVHQTIAIVQTCLLVLHWDSLTIFIGKIDRKLINTVARVMKWKIDNTQKNQLQSKAIEVHDYMHKNNIANFMMPKHNLKKTTDLMYAQKEIQQSVQWIQQNSIIVKELNIQLKIEYTFFLPKIKI